MSPLLFLLVHLMCCLCVVSYMLVRMCECLICWPVAIFCICARCVDSILSILSFVHLLFVVLKPHSPSAYCALSLSIAPDTFPSSTLSRLCLRLRYAVLVISYESFRAHAEKLCTGRIGMIICGMSAQQRAHFLVTLCSLLHVASPRILRCSCASSELCTDSSFLLCPSSVRVVILLCTSMAVLSCWLHVRLP